MAFLTLSTLVSVTLAAFVTVSAHPDSEAMFCASPESYTYTVGETEENLSKTFRCVAVNAHKIEWIVNGNKIVGDGRLDRSTFRSTLQYIIPVGDSIKVICRAWPQNRSDPYVESVPAIISVQSCNCSNQNTQSDTKSQGSVTYTSPAVTYSVAGLLGISIFINIVLVVVIIGLWRGKKQGITGRRIGHDGDDDDDGIGGPRQHKPQGGDENIRRRKGQRS